MRNHLAEDMLNLDALLLFQAYQNYLKDGSILDSTIEFLQHTSSVIKIFRDRHAVSNPNDERLSSLQNTLNWFVNWRKAVPANNFFSKECADDFESVLVSFPQVCKLHLKDFPQSCVVPSRFNSDIVENFFCQQRGLHNGNKTNPNYRDYCSTVNSIVLGQSLISRGRKSNAGLQASEPLSKKFKKQLPQSSSCPCTSTTDFS